MGLEAIISAIVSTGIKVAPRIIEFFRDLHNGEVPTQERVDDVWARHRAAYDAAMAEDASTHPE